ILTTIAAAMTPPSAGLANQSAVATPAIRAMVPPLRSAIFISRHTARQLFESVSWFLASARPLHARVRLPALPPTPATVGTHPPSATQLSLPAPKPPTAT